MVFTGTRVFALRGRKPYCMYRVGKDRQTGHDQEPHETTAHRGGKECISSPKYRRRHQSPGGVARSSGRSDGTCPEIVCPTMKRVILWMIRQYQRYLSPDTGLLKALVAPVGGACRYTPTCSEYTYQAIETYGIIRGSFLGFKRILRCHPWATPKFDPVPKRERTL